MVWMHESKHKNIPILMRLSIIYVCFFFLVYKNTWLIMYCIECLFRIYNKELAINNAFVVFIRIFRLSLKNDRGLKILGYPFIDVVLALLDYYYQFIGWFRLFCPSPPFGYNIEILREGIPWINACVYHAICVEGGMVIVAVIVLFNDIDLKTSFPICESLFCD